MTSEKDAASPDAASPDAVSTDAQVIVADAPPDAALRRPRTVFTILLEDHDYDEIVGSVNAPYINSLIAQGALATNYKDTIHPSTGNYLHLISGDNQYPGIVDIGPMQTPYFPSDSQHLGSQFQAANIKWRAYQESMGTPCFLSTKGRYIPTHNPFVYFSDLQSDFSLCAQVDVDFEAFAADLATNEYRYMWITPDLVNDGHDPHGDPVVALQQSDTWLSLHVPAILASEGFTNGGVLFITWDEAENRTMSGPDRIPMIVVSPLVKEPGMTSATAFDHGSYTAAVEDLLGLPRLATVATAASLMEFLNP